MSGRHLEWSRSQCLMALTSVSHPPGDPGCETRWLAHLSTHAAALLSVRPAPTAPERSWLEHCGWQASKREKPFRGPGKKGSPGSWGRAPWAASRPEESWNQESWDTLEMFVCFSGRPAVTLKIEHVVEQTYVRRVAAGVTEDSASWPSGKTSQLPAVLFRMALSLTVLLNMSGVSTRAPDQQKNSKSDIVLAENLCWHFYGSQRGHPVIAKKTEWSKNPAFVRKQLVCEETKCSLIVHQIKSRNYVPVDGVWLEGDNLQDPADSRSHEPLPSGLIRGRILGFGVWVSLQSYVTALRATDFLMVSQRVFSRLDCCLLL